MSKSINTTTNENFNIQQDELSSYTASLSVADILRFIDKSNGNQILQIPEFQRDSSIKNNKSVWKHNTKLIFIDSLLHGLPTPSILIWEKINGNKKELFLLDGSQRISSINDFVNPESNNGKLKWCKLKTPELKSSDYYGKSYAQLDDITKTNFKNYRIDSIFIRYTGTSKDSKTREITVISEIFKRLNSGSFNLNRSEIRHAIFFKKKDFVFEKINDYFNYPNSYFYSFLNRMKKYSKNKRGVMEVFLLRLLSYGYFLNNHEEYTFNSSIDYTIDDYISRLNDENEFKSHLERIDKLFKYIHDNNIDSLYACKQDTKDKNNILINKTALHETFTEALFSYVLSKINIDKKIEQILKEVDWKKVEKIKNMIWRKGYFDNINKQSNSSNEACFFYTTTNNQNVWKRFDYLKQNIENESNKK